MLLVMLLLLVLLLLAVLLGAVGVAVSGGLCSAVGRARAKQASAAPGSGFGVGVGVGVGAAAVGQELPRVLLALLSTKVSTYTQYVSTAQHSTE